MSRVEDIVDEWRRNIPKEAEIGDVKKVLDYFFPGHWRQGGQSSHLIVQHDILKALRAKTALLDVNHLGEFTVCHKNGRKVAGIYIKRLIEYGDLVKRIEGKKNEK